MYTLSQRMNRIVLPLLFTVIIGNLSADETKIPLDKVPEIVLKTAKEEVPGITLLEAETEKEDGVTVYELEGEKGNYAYELEISENGKLLELKKEVKSRKS